MKQLYILSVFAYTIVCINPINAQTEWTGPKITFTKTNGADWNLASNQDRITSNVWITRANNQSIFNISDANDNNPNCFSSSPFDTEWAFGTIADGIGNLTFDRFLGADFIDCDFGASGVNLVNLDAVLHLITDDIYIDIKFLSWTSNNAGGGFSYERSTDQSLSTFNFELDNKLKLFPNPSNSFIQISNLSKTEIYSIHSMVGAQINTGVISKNDKIDISNLQNGIYFLKIDNNTVKFIKQ